MKKDDCIFCKIANGEIPARTIYEDDLFRVILDLSPATKGHALILPKEHFQDLYELGQEQATALMLVAQKVGRHMKEVLGMDGLNLVQNNGELAGQTMFHFHLHMIPRYEEDGNQDRLAWNHMDITPEELDELYHKLEIK